MQYPTTTFWSLSIQRQFKKNYILELGYSGNRSYHQIRQGRQKPSGSYTATSGRSDCSPEYRRLPNVQQRRLNPAWGARTTLEVDG